MTRRILGNVTIHPPGNPSPTMLLGRANSTQQARALVIRSGFIPVSKAWLKNGEYHVAVTNAAPQKKESSNMITGYVLKVDRGFYGKKMESVGQGKSLGARRIDALKAYAARLPPRVGETIELVELEGEHNRRTIARSCALLRDYATGYVIDVSQSIASDMRLKCLVMPADNMFRPMIEGDMENGIDFKETLRPEFDGWRREITLSDVYLLTCNPLNIVFVSWSEGQRFMCVYAS